MTESHTKRRFEDKMKDNDPAPSPETSPAPPRAPKRAKRAQPEPSDSAHTTRPLFDAFLVTFPTAPASVAGRFNSTCNRLGYTLEQWGRWLQERETADFLSRESSRATTPWTDLADGLRTRDQGQRRAMRRQGGGLRVHRMTGQPSSTPTTDAPRVCVVPPAPGAGQVRSGGNVARMVARIRGGTVKTTRKVVARAGAPMPDAFPPRKAPLRQPSVNPLVPSAPDAEWALIGSLLIEGRTPAAAVDECSKMVDHTSFLNPAWACAWRSIWRRAGGELIGPHPRIAGLRVGSAQTGLVERWPYRFDRSRGWGNGSSATRRGMRVRCSARGCIGGGDRNRRQGGGRGVPARGRSGDAASVRVQGMGRAGYHDGRNGNRRPPVARVFAQMEIDAAAGIAAGWQTGMNRLDEWIGGCIPGHIWILGDTPTSASPGPHARLRMALPTTAPRWPWYRLK